MSMSQTQTTATANVEALGGGHDSTLRDALSGAANDVGNAVTAAAKTDNEKDERYYQHVAEVISEAQKRFDDLTDSELRGLPRDYLRGKPVGYIPDYQHQKMSGTRRTARVIFVLGGEGDKPSLNAVLTMGAREFFKKCRGKFGKATEKCLGEGNKLLFHPQALDDGLVVVTEGEWDALSVMFATDDNVKACALGGAGVFGDLKRRLKDKTSPPKVIILFDSDVGKKITTGQKKAPELLKELSEMGIVAAVKYFDDFMTDEQKQAVGDGVDANLILRRLGKEALKVLVDRIVESARADFEAVKTQIKQAAANATQTNSGTTEGKEYSPEIKDLMHDINTTVTPAELENRGYLRHSDHGDSRPAGYCCPWCGSGDGEHKTGALKYFADTDKPHFGCGKCGGGGNVITLVAHVKGLSTRGKDFFATLREIADEFGVPYDPKIFTVTKKRPAIQLPRKLKLPSDVEIQGNEIIVVGKPKKSDDQPPKVSAARTLILPTKKLVADGGNLRYEVQIRSPQGKWLSAVVAMRTLVDPARIYELAGFGANIASAKLVAHYFSELLAMPENDKIIPEVTVYNRPGWHGDKFIYPVAEDDSYVVERAGIAYGEIFAARGDKDVWLKQFWDVVNGRQGALKRIVLGACLLAPMLRIIRIPNPQFNLWGSSNLGKTPLPKLGMSVYGDPHEGAMLRTFAATAKNMLTMAAGFNDLPLMVDEGETMSQRTQDELSKFVYDYSLGIIGQANRRDGSVRSTEKFCGVRISTAERPLHDVTDKRGGYKRLIDLHVKEALFDDSYARKLHIACENNFGHFGRQWTAYITTHQDQIRADFEAVLKWLAEVGFVRDGMHAKLSSVDATNARAVIACVVAYRHFSVCLQFDTEFDKYEARADAAAILSELPTVDTICDVKRSVELLASWVAENPRRFIMPKKARDGTPIDRDDRQAETYSSTVGKQFANGDIGFFANAFRNIVAEIGLPSYEKFLYDMYDNGYLECTSNREKCIQKKIDGKNTRMYVIKSGVLFAEDTSAVND